MPTYVFKQTLLIQNYPVYHHLSACDEKVTAQGTVSI